MKKNRNGKDNSVHIAAFTPQFNLYSVNIMFSIQSHKPENQTHIPEDQTSLAPVVQKSQNLKEA